MLLKKFVGKPYAGKLHVRFDEGAGKVLNAFPLYSTFFVYFLIKQKVKKLKKLNKVLVFMTVR
jgi:hypothetical protein